MIIKVFGFPVNETMLAVNSCQEKYRYWTAAWAYYDMCDKDSFITLRGTSVIRACVSALVRFNSVNSICSNVSTNVNSTYYTIMSF